jgi:hypothetical protein
MMPAISESRGGVQMKISTLKFNQGERRQIEKAARKLGWKTGESAQFARQLLLESVEGILRARGTAGRRLLESRTQPRSASLSAAGHVRGLDGETVISA